MKVNLLNKHSQAYACTVESIEQKQAKIGLKPLVLADLIFFCNASHPSAKADIFSSNEKVLYSLVFDRLF